MPRTKDLSIFSVSTGSRARSWLQRGVPTPKSSTARRTPSALSAASVRAVATGSPSTAVSVISRHSRCAARGPTARGPTRRSRRARVETSWRADTLTDDGHVAPPPVRELRGTPRAAPTSPMARMVPVALGERDEERPAGCRRARGGSSAGAPRRRSRGRPPARPAAGRPGAARRRRARSRRSRSSSRRSRRCGASSPRRRRSRPCPGSLARYMRRVGVAQDGPGVDVVPGRQKRTPSDAVT